MSLSQYKLASLKDKLNEVKKEEVPADVPVEEAKAEEVKTVKKELKKVKGGK